MLEDPELEDDELEDPPELLDPPLELELELEPVPLELPELLSELVLSELHAASSRVVEQSITRRMLTGDIMVPEILYCRRMKLVKMAAC